jgi:hypothetical protein
MDYYNEARYKLSSDEMDEAKQVAQERIIKMDIRSLYPVPGELYKYSGVKILSNSKMSGVPPTHPIIAPTGVGQISGGAGAPVVATVLFDNSDKNASDKNVSDKNLNRMMVGSADKNDNAMISGGIPSRTTVRRATIDTSGVGSAGGGGGAMSGGGRSAGGGGGVAMSGGGRSAGGAGRASAGAGVDNETDDLTRRTTEALTTARNNIDKGEAIMRRIRRLK